MRDNGHVELPFNQSHAFIIGINDYQHLTPLKTAVNDAKGLAERLEAQHGYIIHGPYLDPTKDALNTLFTETIPSLVKKEDRIIFYFAGHGIALDGENGPNGYIVPKDAKQGDRDSLLPMNLLHDSLNALPCQHGMLILDCCFSGAFKWSTGFRDVVFDLPKIIYEERFWRYVKDPAWQVITSSAYDQKAVDVISNQSIGMREEGEGIHSPFAKALFEAIDGAGDVIPADQGDGVITASELYAYLRDAVESETNGQAKRQSPSMFNLGRHDKGEFIFLNPRHRFNLPPTPDRNPFMGLASYEEADSNFFFGRDRVIEALVEKVKANPLTVVSGASGTGKSSVIKAGLLPKLRKEGWDILPVIRPGKKPMKVLQEDLPDLDVKQFPDDRLSDIENQLAELFNKKSDKKVSKLPSSPNLLIIDQYEELISQCLKEEDRYAFEAQLADWLNKIPSLHIVLSVRSDFEPQFDSEILAPWWQKGRYVVPTFSLEEIREVITKPALQAVLFYEPIELVDKIEEDVSQAPGALPLLSFSLSELYYAYLESGRQDRALTIENYREMGGLIGSLRSKADEVYLKQEELHQSSMRKLMLRMVSLEGGELAARRVYNEELTYSSEDESRRIALVANQLVDARLAIKGKDPRNRVYLEPAHDALVRAWARLWEWIKALGEEKLIWQNKLSEAVGDYHNLSASDSKKAMKLLWNNNPRLDILKAELATQNHSLNAKEEAFVIKSIQRRKTRRQQLISSLIAATVILGLLAIFANSQRIKAEGETKKALASGNASKALSIFPENHTAALNLAQMAFHYSPDNEDVQQALLEISSNPEARFTHWVGQFSNEVTQVKFSPSGDTLLTSSQNGRISFLNHAGARLKEFQASQEPIYEANFSSDGKYLICGGADGIARVFDQEAKLIQKLDHGKPISSALLLKTEEKYWAISADSAGSIWKWDLDGEKIKIFPPNRLAKEDSDDRNIYDLKPKIYDNTAGEKSQRIQFFSHELNNGIIKSIEIDLDGEIRKMVNVILNSIYYGDDWENREDPLWYPNLYDGTGRNLNGIEDFDYDPSTNSFLLVQSAASANQGAILISGEEEHYFETSNDVEAARFHPNSNGGLFTVQWNKITWLDFQGGKKATFFSPQKIASIEISTSSSKLLGVSEYGDIYLWDLNLNMEGEFEPESQKTKMKVDSSYQVSGIGISFPEFIKPKELKTQMGRWVIALDSTYSDDSRLILYKNGIAVQEIRAPLNFSFIWFGFSKDAEKIYTGVVLFENRPVGLTAIFHIWPNHNYAYGIGSIPRLTEEELTKYKIPEEFLETLPSPKEAN